MVATSTRDNAPSLPELSLNVALNPANIFQGESKLTDSGPRGATNGPTSQGSDERSRTNPSVLHDSPTSYHATSTTENHSHRHSGSTPRHSDARNSHSQGNEEAFGAERAAGPQISDKAQRQETVRGGHEESPTSSSVQRGEVGHSSDPVRSSGTNNTPITPPASGSPQTKLAHSNSTVPDADHLPRPPAIVNSDIPATQDPDTLSKQQTPQNDNKRSSPVVSQPHAGPTAPTDQVMEQASAGNLDPVRPQQAQVNHDHLPSAHPDISNLPNVNSVAQEGQPGEAGTKSTTGQPGGDQAARQAASQIANQAGGPAATTQAATHVATQAVVQAASQAASQAATAQGVATPGAIQATTQAASQVASQAASEKTSQTAAEAAGQAVGAKSKKPSFFLSFFKACLCR